MLELGTTRLGQEQNKVGKKMPKVGKGTTQVEKQTPQLKRNESGPSGLRSPGLPKDKTRLAGRHPRLEMR